MNLRTQIASAFVVFTVSQSAFADIDNSKFQSVLTKYVKGGNGKYEKRFGTGPDAISKPPSGS